MEDFIELYTDGAASGNPGPGGFGVVELLKRPALGQGAVEPLDLPGGGGRAGLGQQMLDAVLATHPVEEHLDRLGGVAAGEHLPVVGQDFVGHAVLPQVPVVARLLFGLGVVEAPPQVVTDVVEGGVQVLLRGSGDDFLPAGDPTLQGHLLTGRLPVLDRHLDLGPVGAEGGQPVVQGGELFGDPVPVALGEAGPDTEALLHGRRVRVGAHRRPPSPVRAEAG